MWPWATWRETRDLEQRPSWLCAPLLVPQQRASQVQDGYWLGPVHKEGQAQPGLMGREEGRRGGWGKKREHVQFCKHWEDCRKEGEWQPQWPVSFQHSQCAHRPLAIIWPQTTMWSECGHLPILQMSEWRHRGCSSWLGVTYSISELRYMPGTWTQGPALFTTTHHICMRVIPFLWPISRARTKGAQR